MIFDTSQPLSKLYSRRDFLRAALAAGVLPILPGWVRAASPVPKRLVAGTRVLEVNGRPAKVFGLTGPDGRAFALPPASGSAWTSSIKLALVPSSIGMGSFRPGRRTASHGRRPHLSLTARIKPMTMLRFPARIGCIRITACRSRA